MEVLDPDLLEQILDAFRSVVFKNSGDHGGVALIISHHQLVKEAQEILPHWKIDKHCFIKLGVVVSVACADGLELIEVAQRVSVFQKSGQIYVILEPFYDVHNIVDLVAMEHAVDEVSQRWDTLVHHVVQLILQLLFEMHPQRAHFHRVGLIHDILRVVCLLESLLELNHCRGISKRLVLVLGQEGSPQSLDYGVRESVIDVIGQQLHGYLLL